jgi:GTPase
LKSGNKIEKKKAVIVALWNQNNQLYFEEMEELLANIGYEVVEKIVQKMPRVDRKFYVGPGKALEIKHFVESTDVDVIVFDDELTPLQRKKWKYELEMNIMDRTEVILSIFAVNAGSIEARLQVELAGLKYSVPEIGEMTRGTSRSGGGIGAKGSGEKEGEYKRRNIAGRIKRIEDEIETIKNRAIQQKQGRSKKNLKIVSLVGYTNAGKSTLMNVLTKAGVLEENRVFSTLDTRLKKMYRITDMEVLVSDTVGFIRKLPHVLVASFKSTLDEIKYSDVILHVVDISKDSFEDDIIVTKDVLEEIGAEDSKVIYIFNKIDKCDNLEKIHIAVEAKYENAIFISAYKKLNIDELVEKIREML